MSFALAVDMTRGALLFALLLGGPLLLVAVAVGLFVGVLQAVTQIQEQTVAFAAKLIAMGLTFLLLLSWMLQLAVRYTADLLRSLPSLAS